MVVQISQTTMDLLVNQANKAQLDLDQATQKVSSSTAQRDAAQNKLNDINALIANSQVVRP